MKKFSNISDTVFWKDIYGNIDNKEGLKMKIDNNKGEVTYWSVYEQRWKTEHVLSIPDREFAAMNLDDRRSALRLFNDFACKMSHLEGQLRIVGTIR